MCPSEWGVCNRAHIAISVLQELNLDGDSCMISISQKFCTMCPVYVCIVQFGVWQSEDDSSRAGATAAS